LGGAPEDAAEAERLLLEAVAEEFGVRMPRHALTHGRLHTFTTRSWTRPPGNGGTYAVIRTAWGTRVPDGQWARGGPGPAHLGGCSP
ncbi:SMI1/KNR4 family protein, partial [Streptomyces sp. TRM76130]|nr:SMI1/KNR4 family protein [Streptomyces sp. TRM76130]